MKNSIFPFRTALPESGRRMHRSPEGGPEPGQGAARLPRDDGMGELPHTPVCPSGLNTNNAARSGQDKASPLSHPRTYSGPQRTSPAPRPTHQPRCAGNRRGWPNQTRPETASAHPAAGRAITAPTSARSGAGGGAPCDWAPCGA